MSCNPGYFLRGTQFKYHQQLTCNEDGNFGTLPHCDGKLSATNNIEKEKVASDGDIVSLPRLSITSGFCYI